MPVRQISMGTESTIPYQKALAYSELAFMKVHRPKAEYEQTAPDFLAQGPQIQCYPLRCAHSAPEVRRFFFLEMCRLI